MKWSDLSFEEKKQIYDSIKAQNPDTTYLDIKSQFDSIPAYEDGGKKIMPPKELGLTPGTPEYYKRQQQISGKASTVQPEAYITPAGYVKDAINFVEDLSNGDYTGAAVDAALNIIPWGVGKTLKKFKSKVGRLIDGIAGSIKYEAEPGVDYITNPYLRYLADPGNTYTTKELRDAGFHSAAKNKRYLLNPTESKSHMLTLKRALKDSNKISKWSDPVDENMILDYFRSGKANGAVRNQYDLYIDKQRYIDRLNRLVPMEWLLPTIGLGGAEFLREKQNNKSN